MAGSTSMEVDAWFLQHSQWILDITYVLMVIYTDPTDPDSSSKYVYLIHDMFKSQMVLSVPAWD